MQRFTISKRNGKTRQIYSPSHQEKELLRGLLPGIAARARTLDSHGVSHGFMTGRSPVTNAMQHIGWALTLTMDLKDFFDTVKPDMIRHAQLPNEFEVVLLCFVDGAARQGLPTSPALANIAASVIDRDICAMRSKGRFTKVNFCFTRYADDLTFSFDSPAVGEMLKQVVPEICARHGFEVNHAKTKLQAAVAGVRQITGVGVTDTGIVTPRWIKRRLRAGEHQLRTGIKRRHLRTLIEKVKECKRKGGNSTLCGMLHAGVRGIREWSQLRLPKAARRSAQLDLFANSVGAAVRQVVVAVASVPGIRWLARKLVR